MSRKIKRIVVKIGSSVIATYKMKPRTARLRSLMEQVSVLKKQGVEVVIVSSGAIVLGMGEMGLKRRPLQVAALQALAAIGQTVLMHTFSRLFKKTGDRCAQVLLTWDDFDERRRYNNARNTLRAILDRGVIPVVNENDTISTDEIRFGDNDKLSAFVATLVHADLLVLLSDVEGFYETSSGEKKVLKEIREITQEIEGAAGDTAKKHMSKGGMSAKLQAVKIAVQSRIPCVIAHGEADNVLLRLMAGERVGTLFIEKEEKLLAKKHWISFGAKPKGAVTVDDGARTALLKGGVSLLLPGVVSWDGHFKANDVIVVKDQNGSEIARGITNYSVADLHKVSDKKGRKEFIHCDHLVLRRR